MTEFANFDIWIFLNEYILIIELYLISSISPQNHLIPPTTQVLIKFNYFKVNDLIGSWICNVSEFANFDIWIFLSEYILIIELYLIEYL